MTSNETAGVGPPGSGAVDRPIVSLLTPAGRGAIAVVRVAGSGSVRVADAVFRPHRGVGLARTAPGRIRLGRMGRGLGDEVVAVVLDEEPPAVELQCHGGVSAVEMVIDALERAGAVRSDPALFVETWTADAIAAEATLDLCRAPTIQTAEILLEQAEGALRRELLRVKHLIDQDPSTAPALRCLDELIGRSAVGLRLLAGWKVVIAGRPNVGKSRLLNALAGFTRAIVDPTPGTTRDIVTVSTALEGWPIELADTAGLRAPATRSRRRGSLDLAASRPRPTSSWRCSTGPSRSSQSILSWSRRSVTPSWWRINRTCLPRGRRPTYVPSRSRW